VTPTNQRRVNPTWDAVLAAEFPGCVDSEGEGAPQSRSVVGGELDKPRRVCAQTQPRQNELLTSSSGRKPQGGTHIVVNMQGSYRQRAH